MGSLSLVQTMLNTGISVDCTDTYGDTPLCKAARNGHQEVIDLLLTAGANINHKGSADMPAIMQAAVEGRIGLVKHLVSKGATVSSDLLGTINLKVNIFEENAEAGQVRPEAVEAWKGFLQYLIEVYTQQHPEG